jgi:hypothetical protein
MKTKITEIKPNNTGITAYLIYFQLQIQTCMSMLILL